jgi:hypothetical protein
LSLRVDVKEPLIGLGVVLVRAVLAGAVVGGVVVV